MWPPGWMPGIRANMAMDDSRLLGTSIGRLIKSVTVACICTMTSSATVAFAFREKLEGFDPGLSDLNLVGAIVQVGILGPVIESLLVGFLISAVLIPLLSRRLMVVVASAVLFASLHAAFNVYWGIVVFIPFVVYSYLFVRYLQYGRRWAYGMSFLVHAIHNICAVIAAFFAG